MKFCDDISLKVTHLEKKAVAERNKYEDLENRLELKFDVLSGDGKGNSPYIVNVKIFNNSDRTYKGIIRFELSTAKKDGKIFMPAYMYSRNGGDREQYSNRACYPQLKKGYKKCMSEYWQVRGDRLSHPLALAYVDDCIFGVSSSPYYGSEKGKYVFWDSKTNTEFIGYNGFYCSIKNGTSVGFTLGYENAPYTYILTPKYANKTSAEDKYFIIESNSIIEIPLYIYCYQAKCEYDISQAIENCYYRYHQSPRKRSSVKDAVKDIANAIFNDAYVADKKNYATVVRQKKGQTVKETDNISIGWTGGAEIATPLLMAGARLNDEKMRIQAIECIDNIVRNSLNLKSGLPYDAYNSKKGWTEKGWWYSGLKIKGHNSYVIAQAVYYILKAYEIEKNFNKTVHCEWLKFAEKVLAKILTTQNNEGAFPYAFSVVNGSGIEYSGYAGCWCYAAMAYYAYITASEKYNESLIKANEYYYGFVKKAECYGTPPDTYLAADSEGVLAFIKASRFMHMMTEDEKYLNQMKDALNYEFSFKFAYNSKVQVPPLSKIGWSSSGGSVTSVCNPHIHPMSNNIIDDMIYYLNKRSDDYVKSRLNDTILWGLQTYNSFDDEFDYGKKGWMTERFCYSEGLLTERYSSGEKSSVWFAFLPWGAANVIEGFCGELWRINNEK